MSAELIPFPSARERRIADLNEQIDADLRQGVWSRDLIIERTKLALEPSLTELFASMYATNVLALKPETLK